METFVETKPADRHYLTRGTRTLRVRAVCMLIATIALAISAVLLDPMYARYYETAADQHRTINCSNSSITLDTQTMITIQCTRSVLRVHLLRGEALLRTTEDPSKSAVVLAGDTQVYDFGSVFSVRRSADRTTVTVVEGLVELDEMPVRGGERATVMNADSEQVLGSRRIVYSAAATGVIG